MEYKPLPIGIDNFEEIIQKGCYYVDKTLLIKNILDGASKVTLFTRPRRFGKSLNLSMLKYFLERSENISLSGAEESVVAHNRELFQGLKIMSAGEKYQSHMGKYPVIMLNFKEGKQGTFASSFLQIRNSITREFLRHKDVLKKYSFEESIVEQYQTLMRGKEEADVYVDSVKFLCECLEKAYGEKVVLLLDEYDVPLENAHFEGFYKEMIHFVRGVLGGALKTNNSLAFAVITGCLRIGKESIFTGLNNLEVVSIENKEYGEYFGFTEEEVEEMLVHYDRTSRGDTVREWYNGYVFGVNRVYNPWSLVNYMKTLSVDEQAHPIPYWSHSSGNSIVKDLVFEADLMVKNELEILVAGGSIEKAIHEDITYEEMSDSKDNIWNFLYFTGYLTKVGERFEIDTNYVTMEIPNAEVRYIYRTQIHQWIQKFLEQKVKANSFLPLYQGTIEGDEKVVEKELIRFLMGTISYYDSSESFYHGLLSGVYNGIEDYYLYSNVEVGNGRPDLVLLPPTPDGKAFIIEIKVTKDHKQKAKKAEEALKQIEEKEYREGLEARDFKNITCYGIAFCEKSCVVKKYVKSAVCESNLE